MTEANGDKPRGRFTLAMLALIFLGPLALAAWLLLQYAITLKLR